MRSERAYLPKPRNTMRAPSTGRLSLTTGAEPQCIGRARPDGDREPTPGQIRTEDAPEMRVDRPPLPELLVPGVLQGVREAVGEHERQVRGERARDAWTRERECG